MKLGARILASLLLVSLYLPVGVVQADTDAIAISLSAVETPGVEDASVTVTASSGGITDTSYTGTVNFSSSDGAATLPGPYTFVPSDAGVATFSVTFATLGSQTLTVLDAGSLTDTATTFVDTAPNAVADSATIAENAGSTAIDVLANDSDPDGDTITVTAHGAASHGTVTIDGGGTGVHYTPAVNFSGSDSFTYTISDGTLTDSATVSVTVTHGTNPPNAVADSATIAENAGSTAIDVLANDSDPDGDTITVTAHGAASHGTVTIDGGGTGVHYTPAVNFSGSDSFTYTISDGTLTDSATVSVTVTHGTNPPNAVADSATIAENAGSTAIDVLANDSDPDGDTITVTAHGAASHGTVTIDGGGTGVHYTPAVNFSGSDSFTYTISDGTLTDSATVSVTVTHGTNPPNAVADSATIAENAGSTAIDVLANDSDPDGDTITVTAHGAASHGTVTIDGGGTGVHYTPAVNFSGSDSFTYTISDGTLTDSATVSVTVTHGLHPPVPGTDTPTIAENAGSTAINVLANDTDPDGDSLTVTAVANPPHGTASVDGGGGGIHYTPDHNFFGTDTFTYTVTDGAHPVSGTVTVTVTHGLNPPVPGSDTATVLENAASTAIDVLANDTDPDGDSLTVTVVADPPNGSATVDPGNGGIHYTPDHNFFGIDTFTYTVSDGVHSVSGTVTVTVTHVNQNPVGVGDAPTVLENATSTPINVLANDTDPESDSLTITGISIPAHGTASVDGDSLGVHYQPTLDFNGLDSFTYDISDGHGGTATGTVTVTVTPVNQVPFFTKGPDRTLVQQSSPVVQLYPGWATSISPGAANEAGQVLTFSLSSDNSSLFSTQPAINSGTGDLTFTLAANRHGVAHVNVVLADNGGTLNGGVDTSAPQTMVITVNPSGVDTPPAAINDFPVVVQGSGPVTINVLGNDFDPDGDPLTIIGGSHAVHGANKIAANKKSMTYDPTGSFIGTDQFVYVISDGRGGIAYGTVQITVVRDTFAPVATRVVPYIAAGYPITSWATLLLAWNGSDQGYGIKYYQLQENRNNSTWVSLAVPVGARMIHRAVAINSQYQYRVRAVDQVGNVGAWAYLPNFRASIVPLTSATYNGAWSSHPVANMPGGHTKFSSTRYASANFSCTCSSVSWFGPEGPTQGTARVYVDGVLAGFFSEHTTRALAAEEVFAHTWSSVTLHTIGISVYSGRVDVGGFLILH